MEKFFKFFKKENLILTTWFIYSSLKVEELSNRFNITLTGPQRVIVPVASLKLPFGPSNRTAE